MIRKAGRIGLLLVLPWLHGCGEPRADTSSPEASFRSLRVMYRSMPPARRVPLEWAVELVSSDDLNDKVRRMAFANEGDAIAVPPAALNGKTADAIIALAMDRCAHEDRDFPICHDPRRPH